MILPALSGILILFWYIPAALLIAGPVNSPGSYPYAEASSRGDRLTLGDVKGLVYWREQGIERAAAVSWQQKGQPQQRYSGGLAEVAFHIPGNPVALACAGPETHIFYPDRDAAYPAGRWVSADALGSPESGARRCAMQKSGDFAEFFAARSLVVVNRQARLPVPADFQNAELVAAGEGFVLLTAGRALSVYTRNGSWRLSDPWTHGVSNVTEETRWDGNDRLLLKADPDGNVLADLTLTVDGPRTQSIRRLPVNPCESGQVCGLSLALDNSWVLSGYWGHYLGRDQTFIRLAIPLSIGEGPGAVAIAHNADGGRFIYLGWDDGDQGQLPFVPRTLTDRTRQRERYMIWTRADDRKVNMRVWNAPLPDMIPSTWVAWEPGYEWTLPQDEALRAANDNRWWLDRLGAVPARELFERRGVPLQRVHAAVIDSGVDPTHPWLQAQLARKPLEQPDNGLDDDGNGFVDDAWGYDFVEEDAMPQDDFGHGSHVAGLMIGQKADDIRNPAPNLILTVVRALDRSGKSNSIDLARALQYAADSGAEIINCSWGGGPDTQALRDAFAMLRERGIIVFSSAGNDRLDTDKNPDVPKKYTGVISVAASDQNNQLASFSSYGQTSVRFVAPGDAIVSSVPGGSWGEKSGTSMASPLAAAGFALIWGAARQLHPELDRAAQIELVNRILCESADRKGVESRSQCGRLRLLEGAQKLLDQG
ncbi:MAG: S8 family serine peptidase [Pseudobdellovibrionaceae bacterium]|nr:S8 family serine peptidase [Pseudobdellovibrionaceae bacterium]